MTVLEGWRNVTGRWNRLFRDHELIVRTEGQVRYLRLSATVQRRTAFVAATALGAWIAATGGLFVWQGWTSAQSSSVEARAAAVQQAEARVAAERQTVEQIAERLDSRQDQLETLVKQHFAVPDERAGQPAPAAADGPSAPAVAGTSAAAPAVAGASAAAPAVGRPAPAAGATDDRVARLQQMGLRQDAFVRQFTRMAAARATRAEQALLAVGLKPLARGGQGGPFIPWGRSAGKPRLDPGLSQLAATLDRMERVESLLLAVPSGRPADGMEPTSGFGYRYDPFNGQRAMHAGIDFRGPHGSPIRAAADGEVSFVGTRSGYGNVVEVTHGHGLMTRYAHLAGFTARVGQAVRSGDQVGRMGSTGRSTGTHLHFEVRVNGTAVNPRPFLEANPHVLEIKADARERVLGRVAAG